MKNKKLYRSCDDRVIAGVSGGLGEYFEVDSILVRLIWLILLLSGGLGLPLYLIAWVLIPNDPKCGQKKAADEIKERTNQAVQEVKKMAGKNSEDKTQLPLLAGLLFLVIGLFILMQNLTGLRFWQSFWPVILIIFGLALIYKRDK